MCRFCACKLSKSELSNLCTYKKNNDEYNVSWATINNVVDYYPSNFLQPKNGLPVILDGKHLQSSESQVFCPMYWNLIPSWCKDFEKWQAFTHNARIENILESKLYSQSLSEGKRCIIIIEGFFEYKKIESQPADVYYIHSPGNKLLKVAGLFSTTERDNGITLRSCTIITTESICNVSQVHHRTPVLLHEESDIEAWLDFSNISSMDALAKIKSNNQLNLKFYKTSKMGSREPALPKKRLASKSVMSNWLQSGSDHGAKRSREN